MSKYISNSRRMCKVVDATEPGLFVDLTEDEIKEYKEWANKQPKGTTISPVWHPVTQDQLFVSGKGMEVYAD